MNIEELYKKKEELEDQISDIDEKIKDRWQKLLGFGCGYFDDWFLNDALFLIVKFEHRGDHGSDEIPIRFFEMKDEEQAVKEYKAYIADKKKQSMLEAKIEKERREKTEYLRLKNKFE
jgi:hypothetical protein